MLRNKSILFVIFVFMKKVLVIDNYDSFVYNVSAYFEELGQKILVKRADQITVAEVEELLEGDSASLLEELFLA